MKPKKNKLVLYILFLIIITTTVLFQSNELNKYSPLAMGNRWIFFNNEFVTDGINSKLLSLKVSTYFQDAADDGTYFKEILKNTKKLCLIKKGR